MSYIIQSLQSDRCIVSTGHEQDGDEVLTELSSEHYNKVVHIYPPVVGHDVGGTVTGRSGLFIGVSYEGPGAHLIWCKKKFDWKFATNGPAETHSVYVPGKDLYWFDAGGHKHVITQPGRFAKDNEIFFKLVRIDRPKE
ncbi:hypothetical protein AX14_000611 [Amanita brunnescens Koide BX004]|nr:hypothetical protein AX14_000611 [Amanita brunnescens Koide BX004]